MTDYFDEKDKNIVLETKLDLIERRFVVVEKLSDDQKGIIEVYTSKVDTDGLRIEVCGKFDKRDYLVVFVFQTYPYNINKLLYILF